MPTKPEPRAADMNAYIREQLQRRRGAPPADPPGEASPGEAAPPVPSIDAGARAATAPEPDMNALIRQRLGRS